MKTFCCFFFIVIATLASKAQACSEITKLRATPSRFIALANDSASVILTSIDNSNEITEALCLSLSGVTSKPDYALPKGSIYAGHCSFGNSYRLFYFLPDDSDAYSLCEVHGNTQQLISEKPHAITKLYCTRKNLPLYIHAIENAQGVYVCVPPHNCGRENNTMQLLVFDKSSQQIREKNLALPYGGSALETLQILPDSLGNFYILAKQKILARSKNPLSRYFLFYYNFQRNALKEYDLQLHGKNITGALIQFNKQQNIVLTGFFSDDLTLRVKGVFHTQIKAPGGSMSAIETQPFLEAGMEFFSESRKQFVIPDLELDGINIDNKGACLWGERRYSTDHTGIDPLTGRVYNEVRYHNDEIIMARLDSTGKLVANSIINKQQTTRDETLFISYYAFQDDTTYYFAYNDNPANRKESNLSDFVWYSSRSSVPVIARVNDEGKVMYQQEKQTDDLRIVPHLCSGSLLLEADGKQVRICQYKID